MKEAASIINAISGFAWPLIFLIVFIMLLPILRQLAQAIQRGGGAIEVAGIKLTVQENSEQQRKIIESVQEKVAQIELGLQGRTIVSEKYSGQRLGRVLWVDDTPKNNIYIKALLEDRNVSVDIALSTDQGLEKLSGKTYDVVISDMARPGDERAGISLTTALRSRNDNTPLIIFCSTWGAKNLKEEAHRAGANGITSSPQELISMLTAFDVI